MSAASGDLQVRYHGLDALRAAAMSSVLLLHAAVPYMRDGVRGLAWPTHDAAPHPAFDWLFWWLQGFQMPLFFVIAGFFAAMLLQRRGAAGFLTHRVKRILIPYLVACGLLLPLVFIVWCWGWIDEGILTWEEVRRLHFENELKGDVRGPAHLWFLQSLMILSVVMWASALVVPPVLQRWTAPVTRLLRSPIRPLLFAVPTCLVLAADLDIVWAFDNTFTLRPHHLLYRGLFFATGIAMWELRDELDRLRRFCLVYLVLSLAPFTWLMATRGGTPNPLMVAAATALFAWLSIFGWLGVATHLGKRANPTVRWLSDASYWIYLLHLPIVGLVHIVLRTVAIPREAKFLLAILGAGLVTLLTYRLFVRYTFIGTWLNGPRTRT